MGQTTMAAMALNTSEYLPLVGAATAFNATETFYQEIAASIATFKNLQVACNVAPGGGASGNTRTFIVRDNASDTACKCSMQGSTTTCSDTSDACTTVVGHKYDLRVFVSPGATPTATPAASSCGYGIGP